MALALRVEALVLVLALRFWSGLLWSLLVSRGDSSTKTGQQLSYFVENLLCSQATYFFDSCRCIYIVN